MRHALTGFLGFLGLLAFLGLCLTPAPLHARIGDTPMAVGKRYGAAKVAGEQLLCTAKIKDVTYQAQIFFDAKGYVSMEIFSRKNTNPDEGGNDLAELTQDDFDLLLAEEENAVPWRAVSTAPEKRTWLSGNNRAFARYEAANRLFLIFSPNSQPFVPSASVRSDVKVGN
ncbi:MAG TPA: hypothetical protein VIM58_08910 [Candidatus Methylacidiphilales bacterium]